MRLRRAGGALLSAIALAAIAVAVPGAIAADPAPGAGAAGNKIAKVRVGDDFFSPIDMTVKKGTKVKWKWLPENSNPHNVTLTKAPKSLSRKDKKRLKSATGSIGIKFNRKLKKNGKYKFVCTIHRTVMKQTIKVSKKG